MESPTTRNPRGLRRGMCSCTLAFALLTACGADGGTEGDGQSVEIAGSASAAGRAGVMAGGGGESQAGSLPGAGAASTPLDGGAPRDSAVQLDGGMGSDAGPTPGADAAAQPDADVAPGPAHPVEPRFLVVIRDSHYLHLLDRFGTVVRDFGPLVDLGGGHEGVRLSVNGRAVELEGPALGGRTVWFNDFPGAEPHYWKGLRPSRPLVLRATVTATGATRFRVLTVAGELLGDFELPGIWDEPQISPRSGYVAARGSIELGTPLVAVVASVDSGATAWRGFIGRPIFSHDDRYFMFDVDPAPGVLPGHNVLVELPSGTEQRLNPPAELTGHPAVSITPPLGLLLTIDAGIIASTAHPTAEWMWFVPWGGEPVPFDAALPDMARDWIGSVLDDGRVSWLRRSQDREMPVAGEGRYDFDPATRTNQRRTSPCHAEPGETRWILRDNTLEACEGTQDYRPVVELPPLPGQWRYQASRSSYDGERLLVQVLWGGASLNEVYPGMGTFVYDSRGRLLLEAASGLADIDRTGTMVVLSSRTQPTTLIDVDTGLHTPLDANTVGRVLYEAVEP